MTEIVRKIVTVVGISLVCLGLGIGGFYIAREWELHNQKHLQAQRDHETLVQVVQYLNNQKR